MIFKVRLSITGDVNGNKRVSGKGIADFPSNVGVLDVAPNV